MIGCAFESGRANFRVRAPAAERVELLLGTEEIALRPESGGYWSWGTATLKPGARYAFKINGEGPYPDPASRFQPDGVHGFSQAVDTGSFRWTQAPPGIPPPSRRILYELHVGTFSPEGTFDGARRLLPHLRDLGITLIELMPVADFAGRRNWGYDGVFPFAPARAYGTPESLAALVDAAHQLGLCVLLDVVYSHLGPDGNYLARYAGDYFNPARQTPWGAALNFDAPGSAHVRRFFIESALLWLGDYRFDGLRLDATHAIRDESPDPFLAQLAREVRAAFPNRGVLIYAEDERQPARFCRDPAQGGFGLDGLWADDWHHHVRRRAAGDREGYYALYDGSLGSIARALEQGRHRVGSGLVPGGEEDPETLDYDKFILCLQNHDQVGNRALGERLHHQISPELYRALSALLLLAPETPLLFMGQEWGASSPFLYFTDHEAELGKAVTEGRRREFAGFSAFRDPSRRERIPDPQREETFLLSRLNWEERDTGPHACLLRFYRALLALRRSHPALRAHARGCARARPLEPGGLLLLRFSGGKSLACAAWLDPGAGTVEVPPPEKGVWRTLFTSEERAFSAEGSSSPPTLQSPHPTPEVHGADSSPLRFSRPGAWIAEARPMEPP